MDGLREFLDDLKRQEIAQGNFLGLLHVLIGHRIQKADGTLLSNGLTWRVLAELLKKVRWGREAVRELGLDPKTLPPRDRERFWYAAIALAQVDSPKAAAAAAEMAEKLRGKGFVIGPPPRPA